jgi:murein DD-endopeptidase MepM/ murein hydrolase activator NlpD
MLSGASLFVTLASLQLLAGRPGAGRGEPGPPLVPPEMVAPPPADLMARGLVFPVRGIDPASVPDTFTDPRGISRLHNAMDIMAPRGTPVLAVADGTVEQTGAGGAGGVAVYQRDHTGRYAYYYAHLDRLADGIEAGRPLRAGDVLGYVGTTGNAPAGAPHLHFAVYEVGDSPRRWGGRPINPVPLWARAAAGRP